MGTQSPERVMLNGLVIHPAHTPPGGMAGGFILLRKVGDQDIGGQDHRGDGSGVLERAAHDLDRVNDASLDHVGVFVGENVEADILVLLFRGVAADGVNDDRAILAGVGSQFADRGFERLPDDVDADSDLFVFGGLRQFVEFVGGVDEGNFAAGDDAFFDSRAGGREASSTRCFFSFISVSVAAPTRMMATPPLSLARRS